MQLATDDLKPLDPHFYRTLNCNLPLFCYVAMIKPESNVKFTKSRPNVILVRRNYVSI